MSDVLLILLPGAMYFWVLFVGQGPMQEVLEEAESRIQPRILAGPVTREQYVLSKMLRAFLLCSFAIVLLLGSSALLFHISWGHPVTLAAVVGSWAVSMTGIVALLSAVVRTREQANVLSPLVLLTLAMLGGSMFPYESLPASLQMIGQYTPNRWAVVALQAVARSKPVADLVVPVAALLALGVVESVLAFMLFNRRLVEGYRS